MADQQKVIEQPTLYIIFNFILLLTDKLKGIIIIAMLLGFSYSVIRLILPYDEGKINLILEFMKSLFDNKVYTSVLVLLAIVLIISNIICYSGKKKLQKEIGNLRNRIDNDDEYNPTSNIDEYGAKPKK